MKLYKVHTKSFSAYVVARNPLEAEKEFKEWLDSEDYGYTSERVILQIELLAETGGRPNSVTNPVGLLIGAVVDDE